MDPHISVKDIHNDDIHSVEAICDDEGDTHSVKTINNEDDNDSVKMMMIIHRYSRCRDHQQ